MKRRLVQQGMSTLMVSLPSKWIQKLGLKKGDEVSIEQNESRLLISKETLSGKKETKIELASHGESAIRTAIVNAYRTGYDRISIRFKDELQYKIVAKTVKEHLIGFDIADKKADVCVLENITEPAEEQFEAILRKIFYNIRSLIENTELRLQKNVDFEDYEDVVSRIHQYDNFCRRVLAKTDPLGTRTNLFWAFLTLLIHGQRELYHLNIYLDSNKLVFKKELYSRLKEMFALLEEAYFKKDLALIEKIHNLEKKAIYKEAYGMLQKNGKENVVVFHISAAIRNFYLASSPLMGLFL